MLVDASFEAKQCVVSVKRDMRPALSCWRVWITLQLPLFTIKHPIAFIPLTCQLLNSKF